MNLQCALFLTPTRASRLTARDFVTNCRIAWYCSTHEKLVKEARTGNKDRNIEYMGAALTCRNIPIGAILRLFTFIHTFLCSRHHESRSTTQAIDRRLVYEHMYHLVALSPPQIKTSAYHSACW